MTTLDTDHHELEDVKIVKEDSYGKIVER